MAFGGGSNRKVSLVETRLRALISAFSLSGQEVLLVLVIVVPPTH